ncbi:MAG TPA: hypothetical protein VN578_20465 [Candidatus Binatia bacterium]|jgi:hypothetical protein|nr:hypothetical protein [Candidatus Binatia bacterium]
MTTPPPQLLANPQALLNLKRALLIEFLQCFKDLLDAKYLPLLSADLPPADFSVLLSGLLASPEMLPAPMREALAAIHDLAAPENRARLEFTRLHAPIALGIDPQAAPFQQALHLWLNKPFQLPPPAGAPPACPPSDDRAGESTPLPVEPPNGNGQTTTLHSRLPTLHSDAAPPSLDLRLRVLFFELEPRLFNEFIRCFQLDLYERYPDLPRPCLGNEAFTDAVSPLITDPACLLPRMHAALLAIQELAAPQNRQLLLGLLAQNSIPVPPETLPEHLALEYWLRCPFSFGQLDRLRAQLPAEFLNLSPASPNGQNGESTPHSALCNLHSNAPGDLAAIARFPRNKISRLPADVRESINQMLRQRIPYPQIIEKLGDHGQDLNKNNLSRWKKTGYLVWLAEQQRREDAHAQLQLLFDLLREKDNGKIHEATQQMAALRISQVLAAFDPATLSQAFQQNPQAFVRLIQTLPSLSRGGMDCERLLVEFAERKASLEKEENPKKRGISRRTQKYMEQKLNLM